MTSVLDLIYLRRPRIEYTSPPICQDFVPASASGSFVVVEAASAPPAPEIFFVDDCHRYFSWTIPSEYYCASIYRSETISDPLVLVADCVQNGWFTFCSTGWWKIAAILAGGNEGVSTSPVKNDGSGMIRIKAPTGGGVVGWRVYKNPVVTDPNATFFPVLDTSETTLVETCSGCYRIRVITLEGHTELSNILCVDGARYVLNCCPAVTCPPRSLFDQATCSCIPDTLSDLVCPDDRFCLGVPYASQMVAVGGLAPFTWSLVSGSFPPGVTFHAGVTLGFTVPIDGTPTSGGDFSFTVRCQSKSGFFIDKTCSMAGLGISDWPSLPDAFSDTPYSYQLLVSGGTGPYTFTVTSGALPSGFSLSSSGLLTGIYEFSGSFSFGVTVTDSLGNSCETPLNLDLDICPTPDSFEAIVVSSQSALIHSAFDQVRRVWWIPHGLNSSIAPTLPEPPYQRIYRVDTRNSTIGWTTSAEDTLGLVINSSAKGDLGNAVGRCLISAKYNTFIAFGNQSWNSAYDLDSLSCLTVVKNVGAVTQAYQNDMQQVYDNNRGYAYCPNPSFGAGVVSVFDCDPLVLKEIASYALAGVRNGGQMAYVPDTDTLYLVDANGPGIFHKWDPVSHAFTYSQGPATGPSIGIRYCPAAKILLIKTGTTLYFIDPINGDNVLGSTALAGNTINYFAENDCTGFAYLVLLSGSSVHKVLLQSPFTIVTVPGTGVNAYQSLAFDHYNGKLFAIRDDQTQLETHV